MIIDQRLLAQAQRRLAPFLRCLICLSLISTLAISAGLTEFSSALMNSVARRWGQAATTRLLSWKEFIQEEQAQNKWQPPKTEAKTALKNTNRFFNRFPYKTDQAHWGVEDYWATPVEFLGSNAGDCEDFAAAKYFSLRDLGAPVGQLRMVYVRALKINEAHMVLAWICYLTNHIYRFTVILYDF